MTQTLDDYAAAFDEADPPPDPDERWRLIDRAIRRRLRAPTVDLVAGVLILALLVAVALSGVHLVWGYAGFFLLVALPQRWRARKKWLDDIALVESAGELHALCAKQSHDRFTSILAEIILRALLAILFVLVGVVAYLLERSPWPGVLAGLVLILWVAGLIVFALPRAARESSLLDDDEEDDDDED